MPGFDYLGKYTYFLTICTLDRCLAFREDAFARYVIGRFRRTARSFAFAIPAYCVMPDHVHYLLEGRSAAADFRGFVKSAKQSTGQTYAHKQKRRLWQEGFFDHVLRPEEPEILIARYILENPVRAGLVRRVQDYPYLGSDVWPIDEILNAA
jgi:putative transposase